MSTKTISRPVRQVLAEYLDGWRYERTWTDAEWDHVTHDGAHHRVCLWPWMDMVEVISPHLAGGEVHILVSPDATSTHLIQPEANHLPALYRCAPDGLAALLDDLSVPAVNS